MGAALKWRTLNFKTLWALFFLFGFANIPFTYMLSYLFKDYGNAQGMIYFFNFITGGLLPVIILILRLLNTRNSA